MSPKESTSSELETVECLQHDTDSLPIIDIAESIQKANALIDKLEHDESNIFTPSNTKVSQPLDRVIRAMLQCGTDNGGQIYVLQTILLCEKRAEAKAVDDAGRQKQLVVNLRAVGVIWLTHFLFIFKSASRTHFSQFEDIATSSSNDTAEFYTPPESLGTRILDREQVLKRDGHACLLTHMKDVSHPSGVGYRTLDICRILKRVVSDISGEEKELKFQSIVGTLDILRNYTRFDREICESLVDSPCNALTLNSCARESFDNYHFCFKKASNDIPHEYALHFFRPEVSADMNAFHRTHKNGQPLPPNIVFENHHGPDSDMPNEILLEIHSIVASVLHMSGAGRFFDELFRRYPPSRRSRPVIRWADMERHIEVYDLTARQMLQFGFQQA